MQVQLQTGTDCAGDDISRTSTSGPTTTMSVAKLQLHCSLMTSFALTYVLPAGSTVASRMLRFVVAPLQALIAAMLTPRQMRGPT